MDEIIFRSSQKFEDFQFHLSQAASDSKKAIHAASLQTKDAFLSLLDQPYAIQLTDSLKQLWYTLVEYGKELQGVVKTNILNFSDNIYKLIPRKWNREICICCVGFIIGGCIGYVIGKSVSSKISSIYYMQAIQCTNYSGVEGIVVAEDAIAPKQECGNHEVLINVKAASVNEIDDSISKGYGKTIRSLLSKYTSHIKSDFPFTLGRDCTGIVTDIGQNVKRLEVGDEVWVSVPFWYPGTLSQIFVVSECRVALKPKKIGFESACSIPYAGTLALEALEEMKVTEETAPNKRVFIYGGCTPVGCVLIQILKIWKAHITTTCLKRAVPVAKALGANDVIVLPDSEKDILEVLQKELSLKDTFDVVISTKPIDFDFCTKNVISTFPRDLDSDQFGVILRTMFSIYVNLKCISQKIFGYEIGNFGETHSCYKTLDILKKFVENNELQTVVDKVFHPHDIENALSHIKSTSAIGSTVITFR